MLDLHTHSTASDGSDAPERIPELAHAVGCRAVALTDHDRLDGLDAAERRAAELGVGFIRGCEISCEVPSGTMHVLMASREACCRLPATLAFTVDRSTV